MNLNQDQHPPEGITLCDALRQGLVEARSGKVMDRYSGKGIKIAEAISRGIINPDSLEVYDGKKKEKITLKEALAKNIIEDAAGKFVTEKGEWGSRDRISGDRSSRWSKLLQELFRRSKVSFLKIVQEIEKALGVLGGRLGEVKFDEKLK